MTYPISNINLEKSGLELQSTLDFKTTTRLKKRRQSLAHRRMWVDVFKDRQMMGFAFSRNGEIEGVKVDFLCRKLKLVIALERSGPLFKDSGDDLRKKEKTLRSAGYYFLSFPEDLVLRNESLIKTYIERWIRSRPNREEKTSIVGKHLSRRWLHS